MSDELAVPNDDIDERLEKAIWKALGRKSARQIADDTGLSPERVLRAKREMLEAVDVLTIQEKRQKLLVDLQDIAQRTQDDYDAAPWEFKSGLMNSSVAAMKTVMVELARAEKSDNTKIESLNALRVRELLSLLDAVVTSGVQDIADEHGLDEDDLLDVFNRRLIAEAEKRDLG